MASRYTTSKNRKQYEKRWRCRTRDCILSLYKNNDQDNADIVELSTIHKDHCIPDPERRFVE